MMLPHGAIVAVVDGEGLRVLRNGGDEAHPQLVEEAPPPVHSMPSDSGMRHHSSAANPDRRRQEEDGFAAGAAEWLNRQVLGGGVKKLVVVATPKTLGELRQHYHKALRAELVDEIAKDLSGATVAEIEDSLLGA